MTSSQNVRYNVPIAALSLCFKTPTPYPVDGMLGMAKLYTSSRGVQHTFCGKCGAGVPYSCTYRPDMVNIAVGLLHVGSVESQVRGVRAEEWMEWTTSRVG